MHEIGAFVLKPGGYYEAINRNCPYYYLSAESVALFAEHLPTRPSYIVGQVVHIERRIAKSAREGVDAVSNPYGLSIGCEYFIVTVAMLPDTTIHSPTTS